ncbi:winged helix-turn-helix domain-containing protein [Cronobacter dublinensis]|uniref:winged helix-turn-helix domain-containing protein n=1 Tax=Cronobacter dublinensis TaxID=413497 RepID=UPI00300E16B7
MIKIDDSFWFDPEMGEIRSDLTSTKLKLSYTNSMLLELLVTNRGRVTTRDEIFNVVFEKTGATKSNGNLNQCIALIRKTFSELGYEKDIIVTIPKVGFCIQEKVSIEESQPDNLYELNHVVVSEKGPVININKKKDYWTPSLMIFCFVIFLCVITYKFTLQKEDSLIESTISIENCSVSVLANDYLTDFQFKKDVEHIKKTMAENNFSCAKKGKVFFYRNELNKVTSWEFMGFCDHLNKCRSSYTRYVK